MARIDSKIDPGSASCRANRAAWLQLIETFRAVEARTRAASEKARPLFEKRGALLPRERVARALDPGSPFLELASVAGWCQDQPDPQKTLAGGGLIAGIGYVAGVRCMVMASDAGIEAGAIQPKGLDKMLRMLEIALQNKLPLLYLVESAGANLMRYRVEDFILGGGLFHGLTRLSAAGIPVVTVVHGASTAGGAYMPGMSDYVVMVRGRAKAFLAGPALLKAATGEDASEEELGGAEMHASVSGLCEYLAEDDGDGIRQGREIFRCFERFKSAAGTAELGRVPAYDSEDLLALVPLDGRKSYDVHEVIARIVDASDFLDFKPLYGVSTVCGHAEIDGHAVGIIGNNGPIDPAGATKASHFIQLCCQSGTPLVYLQNTTGYIVGKAAESAGMIKHGAKMIQAVAHASVPQITLHIGASFGAGNYGMCGRAYGPRFAFSWPNAKTAVMGAEQAATTMRLVMEAKARRGKGVAGGSPNAEEIATMEAKIIDTFESQSSALYTSGLLLDDGIIDPRDTRKVLAYTLSICREAEARTLTPIQFAVGRH
ncbi:MAG: acyl-CoA carboxylase subunit beta [Betaproteobacteria bacterium]|nr:acyl-CoA carboxylase subunit beta [Betaproteobacteria bacterium]